MTAIDPDAPDRLQTVAMSMSMLGASITIADGNVCSVGAGGIRVYGVGGLSDATPSLGAKVTTIRGPVLIEGPTMRDVYFSLSAGAAIELDSRGAPSHAFLANF